MFALTGVLWIPRECLRPKDLYIYEKEVVSRFQVKSIDKFNPLDEIPVKYLSFERRDEDVIRYLKKERNEHGYVRK